MTFAHFTLTEIPGSVFLIVAGVCIGQMLTQRRFRALPVMGLVLASFAFFDVAFGDHLAPWLSAATDAAWLGVVLAIGASLAWGTERTASGS